MKCHGENPVMPARKIWQWLSRQHRRLFQRRNYIFMHAGPFEKAVDPPCEFKHYERFEDISSQEREAILYHEGQKSLATHRLEMEQAAVMWMALVNNRLAGVIFSRRGRFFKRWFVPLQDDDIVFFRARTYPEFRGRGIAPVLVREAMHSLLQQGNKAYIDCRIYNKPSIRYIEKAGFSRIATMKPISREEALG